MRAQIGDAVVEVELTDLQKRMLAAGNSVTVNLYPDPDHREYAVKDMGFTSPRRVHVDSASHPHPAVDTKRIADYINGGFHYKGTAADLNYENEEQEMNANKIAKKIAKNVKKSTYAVGTVITWESVSRYSGAVFSYAAIYAAGHWYTTAVSDNSHVQREMDDEALMKYLGEDGVRNVRVASEFVEVEL